MSTRSPARLLACSPPVHKSRATRDPSVGVFDLGRRCIPSDQVRVGHGARTAAGKGQRSAGTTGDSKTSCRTRSLHSSRPPRRRRPSRRRRPMRDSRSPARSLHAAAETAAGGGAGNGHSLATSASHGNGRGASVRHTGGLGTTGYSRTKRDSGSCALRRQYTVSASDSPVPGEPTRDVGRVEVALQVDARPLGQRQDVREEHEDAAGRAGVQPR